MLSRAFLLSVALLMFSATSALAVSGSLGPAENSWNGKTITIVASINAEGATITQVEFQYSLGENVGFGGAGAVSIGTVATQPYQINWDSATAVPNTDSEVFLYCRVTHTPGATTTDLPTRTIRVDNEIPQRPAIVDPSTNGTITGNVITITWLHGTRAYDNAAPVSINSVTNSGGKAQFATAANHGLAVNETVTLTNLTGGYTNGDYRVTSVPTATTFEVTTVNFVANGSGSAQRPAAGIYGFNIEVNQSATTELPESRNQAGDEPDTVFFVGTTDGCYYIHAKTGDKNVNTNGRNWTSTTHFKITRDATPPTVDITDVDPDPRTDSVPSIEIVFSEEVTNFDKSELSLTGTTSGAINLAAATLTSTDNTTFTLGNLSGLTNVDEQYTLTLSVGNITDLPGSALSAGATEVWTKQQPAVSISDVTMVEGTGGTTNFDFTVTLDIGGNVTVDYDTFDSTALSTSDYNAATGQVTFVSTLTKTVTVQVVADSVDEASESFRVILSNPTAGTIADATGIGTITDDDTANIAISDATVAENAGTVTVTVSKGTASGGAVSVNYSTQDSSAVSGGAGGDYTATTGSVTWADGATGNRTFTVNITDDQIDESSETFRALLSGVTGNAAISDATGVVTITDNDTANITIADGTVAENAGNIVVTVNKAQASSGAVSVNYSAFDGSAVSGGGTGDYTASTGTVTWNAGNTGNRTFMITITDDNVDEVDETFFALLSGVTGNAAIADATGQLTITDNDTANITVADGAVSENAGTITVTVNKSAASSGTVSVDYRTQDGSALSGGTDYTSTSGTLSWADGATGSRTFTVTINDDQIDEVNETFLAIVSNVSGNATITDATGVQTINDDDNATIAILDGTVAENTGTITVTVRKTGVSAGQVSVDYGTADNSATSTNDYTSTSGTVSWADGLSGDRTFTVTIANDSVAESTETFLGLINNLVGNASISDATGDLAITDADTSGIRILDGTVAENTGTMTVTVRKSGASQGQVSVDYGTADNSATSTNDYTSTSGTVSWASGLSGDRTFTVTITNDSVAESTETFLGLISNVTGNASIADATGNLEITDADTSGIRILDGTVAENTGTITVTVRKSGASQGQVSVDYDTADNSATSTNDYTSTSGTVSWASGLSGDRTFTVTITNDSVAESTETFLGLISNVTGNASIADATGNLEITDADTSGIRILDGTVAENTGTMTVTVRKSGASQGQVSVDYDTADNSATSTNDYTSTSGTVSWASGLSGDRTFTVTITNDAVAESTETFLGLISNVTGNASIADATGNLEITDADTSGIRILDGTVAENTGTITVTVRKSGVSQGQVSVDYNTADNSATSTNDYTSTSGTVSWASGLSGDRTFMVTITNDAVAESTETFLGLISNVTGNASIADATGNLEITDADTSGIRILDGTVAENTGTMTVTVRKSGASQGQVSVDYDTADNSATSTNDYTSTSGTVSWASGLSGDRTFTVTITNDSVAEATETFLGLLSNVAGNATIADATGNLEITDADTSGIRILDGTVAESTGTMTVTVRKSGASQGQVSVDYDTADNSATSTNDYTSTSGTVSWASGLSGDRTFTVTITNDSVAEATETFLGLLSNVTGNATIADATGNLEITDADTSGIRILDGTVAENTGMMTVTVRKNGTSQGQVSVDYNTADNSATSTNDYTSTSGTVSWASGLSGDRTFTVTITNDSIAEVTETFLGLLSNLVGNASIADATGDLEITDTDTSSIRILDGTVAENTGTMTVTVRKSGVSQGQVSVDYDTADNSATSTNDYTSTSGTVSWASGLSGDRTFTVTITNDTVAEVTETFLGLISNVTGNASISDATGDLEITDSDTSGIRILDGTVAENAGTMTVTVRKSGASQGQVSVDYDTADNSATSTNDYTSTSGTVSWASGLSGDRTFTVTITNDSIAEATETFLGLISNLTGNASISDATGDLEITDADTSGIRILDASVAEDAGTMTVTIRKSGTSQGQVSVDYDTADNSATSTNDYTSTSGTVSWASGLSGDRTFTVTITDDDIVESTETFLGLLSNLVGNASIADATGNLEITDDDTSLIKILDATVSESDGTVTVTVRKTGGNQGAVSVDYRTQDSSAVSGVGGDYTSTSGTVSWAPGLTGARTFTVTISDDATDEDDETFLGLLSNVVGSSTICDATGVITITDNDTAPTISIDDITVDPEGDPAGTTNATFTISLSAASGKTITVDYATMDCTATSTGDYTAVSATTVTFNAGQTQRMVTIDVTRDTIPEYDESFKALLSNPTNATIADGTGVATVIDDDNEIDYCIGANVPRENNWVEVEIKLTAVALQNLLFSIAYDGDDLLYNNVIVGQNTVNSNAEVAAVENLDTDGTHDNADDTLLWIDVDANPTNVDIGDEAIGANLVQTVILKLTFRTEIGAPVGNNTIDLTIGNVSAFGTTGQAVTVTPLTNNDEIDVDTDYNPLDVDETGEVSSANDGVYVYRALLYGDLRGLVPIAPESHRASGQPLRATDEEIIANVEALLGGAMSGDSADVDSHVGVTAGRDGVYIYRRIRALADALGDAYTVPAGHTGVAFGPINTAVDALNAINTDDADDLPFFAFSDPENGPSPVQEQLSSNTSPVNIRYHESLRSNTTSNVLTAAQAVADGLVTGSDAGGAITIGTDASAGGDDFVLSIDADGRELTVTPNTAKGINWAAGGTVTITIDRTDLEDVAGNTPAGTDVITVDGP